MNNTELSTKNLRVFGVIFGSLLLGVSAIPLASQAIPVPQVNPCLSLSPEALANQGRGNIAGENCTVVAQATPPLPEELQPPSATVVLVDGTVNIRLVNQTYTDITYQVVGDTEPRTLSGRDDVTLRTLKAPVTVTFQRPDRGLLLVSPEASEAGSLEVTLTETTDLDVDKSAMTIQETGDVFLN
ncbi:MAG: hypothetical protein F6K28_17005 [Microcoleus sp. SIO2G3]|nr:hypothetical protein [Microcoleus sp. SIO2G3]